NTEKEVLEETGLSVHCKKLIAVQDWRRHNRLNCPYGIMKFFVLCEYDSGEFKENIETTETRLFDRNALPDNLADEKTTAEQIRLCFEYYDNPHKETCLE
ncbi:DNA mismatch repair protein MutT, partial [[Eubacterium] siraeum]